MARNGSGDAGARAVTALLRQMFETVNAKPVPQELVNLVDQLDAYGRRENEPAPALEAVMA